MKKYEAPELEVIEILDVVTNTLGSTGDVPGGEW
jgi:hypothetical protein